MEGNIIFATLGIGLPEVAVIAAAIFIVWLVVRNRGK
jgi:hypothetical protein